ncbi:hypothetical protein GCM10009839_94020 [Catenulispora yoronensis]|uniref:J domain-containing protein n=1 Tax=Catenulispora yoronensis TaxID=450799 RepID=A0ABP5HA01_9ACTN
MHPTTQPLFPAAAPGLIAILGVRSDADSDQVTRAFRTRLRALHPDTASDTEAQAARELEAVLAAWQVLHDPARRAACDRSRTPARPKPPTRPPSRTAGRTVGASPLTVGLAGAAARPGAAMWIGLPVWIEHRQSRADP